MGFVSKRGALMKFEFDTEEQRDLYDWMYEYALDHEPRNEGKIAWGQAIGIASDHPEWTFWQVLAEMRRRFGN